eukprot:CAMPEP_0171082012 /NCGR_PEP_ID=MMETSP0766_2-20121228/16846_1 /TAXON_ID=439317 /ORGANISM="Gambierdiscus australes, Strain CAWD 149" /LENGTH=80 /DNA_ID=CAMNT_0011539349 /DNA_START=458 /DNA_END=696 /DNA_ORIENTATION=-
MEAITRAEPVAKEAPCDSLPCPPCPKGADEGPPAHSSVHDSWKDRRLKELLLRRQPREALGDDAARDKAEEHVLCSAKLA